MLLSIQKKFFVTSCINESSEICTHESYNTDPDLMMHRYIVYIIQIQKRKRMFDLNNNKRK